MVLLSLLLAATPDAGPPLVFSAPSVAAVRVAHPPRIDGRLDDEVWLGIPPSDQFTQQVPDPGRQPTQHTSVRLAYDADNLYVAIRCDDTDPETVVNRLTRRDRSIDADGVVVEIDSLGDKTSDYAFAVYSSGTQLDFLRTGDSAVDTNWDAVWDSATGIDDHGYSVELAIPFRVLRFRSAPEMTFRFNVGRFITRREEFDELVYTAPDAQGSMLRMADLTDLRGVPQSQGIALLPFEVLQLGRRHSPGAGFDPPSGTSEGWAVGGDLTYRPTRDLVLDATVLPDFGQVEADQVVLNLTTFETFFPEKRPFFLSGADLFELHDAYGNPSATQLFYSRRVGRPPDAPIVGAGETLLAEPPSTSIWGAAKLTGKLTDHLSIALLDAVPAAEQASFLEADGSTRHEAVASLANFGVARLRADLPGGFTAGAMATLVNQADGPSFAHPNGCPVPGDSNNLVLPPDGGSGPPGPDGRCTHDARSGALDVNWTSSDGAYVVSAAVVGSQMLAGPAIEVPDGTVIRSGDTGFGAMVNAGKAAGAWVGYVSYEGYSPKLDLDTAGYLRQANLHHLWAHAGWRHVEPWGPFLDVEAYAEPSMQLSTDGTNLGSGGDLNVFARWTNHWTTYLELDPRPDHFDNRETRDGAKYERATTWGGTLAIGTDPRKPLGATLNGYAGSLLRGNEEHIGLDVSLNVLSRLELGLTPRIDWSRGDPRWTATVGDLSGLHTYQFADLDARATSVTVRGTYAFTQKITLQAYAQLYVQTNHYGAAWQYETAATQPTIDLGMLQPTPTPPGLDFKAGAFNATLVLRWEYRPGSAIYLVYTRAQMPGNPTPGQSPLEPDLQALRWGPYDDVALLKVSYALGS